MVQFSDIGEPPRQPARLGVFVLRFGLSRSTPDDVVEFLMLIFKDTHSPRRFHGEFKWFDAAGCWQENFCKYGPGFTFFVLFWWFGRGEYVIDFLLSGFRQFFLISLIFPLQFGVGVCWCNSYLGLRRANPWCIRYAFGEFDFSVVLSLIESVPDISRAFSYCTFYHCRDTY